MMEDSVGDMSSKTLMAASAVVAASSMAPPSHRNLSVFCLAVKFGASCSEPGSRRRIWLHFPRGSPLPRSEILFNRSSAFLS